MEHLKELIGKKVVKFSSGKPFKSGLRENTVKGIITHEITGHPAFIFEEDDSYVETQICFPSNLKVSFDEVERVYPGYEKLEIVEFQIDEQSWTKLGKGNKNPEDNLKRCYMEDASKVILRFKYNGEIKQLDYKLSELIVINNNVEDPELKGSYTINCSKCKSIEDTFDQTENPLDFSWVKHKNKWYCPSCSHDL